MIIWIMGHSLFFGAQHLTAAGWGTQLGINHLPDWGMLWAQLLPELNTRCQLKVLILHPTEKK